MKATTDSNIKRSIENVRATQAVEGLKMNRRSIVYGRRYLKGQMTSQEVINNITEHILKKKRKLEH